MTTIRCDACKNPKRESVAECTWGTRMHVCEFHCLVAGANGLMPVRYGETVALLPGRSVELLKQVRNAK
jgi:hypothetical protein